MSSSDPNSKIDFLDSREAVKKKINAAYCEAGVVENSGLLAFIKSVVLPIVQLRQDWLQEHPNEDFGLKFTNEDAPPGTLLSITRKFGDNLHYADYDSIEKDFASQQLHPGDLKGFVSGAIWALLEPIQKQFNESEEWRLIEAAAYPVDKPPTKVGKKKASAFYLLSDKEC